MDILSHLVRQAKHVRGTVIFPEGDEDRTLAAAVRLAEEGVCRCVLSASKRGSIEALARKKKYDLSSVSISIPSLDEIDTTVWQSFKEKMAVRGVKESDCVRMALQPLNFAALYVKSGSAASMVAGARADTADVLRAAIYGLGMAKGVRLMSSFFLMVPPPGHPLVKKPLLFADCAVNPDPGALALCDIACASIQTFLGVFPNETARVAFLSYSTKGSASHPGIDLIREGMRMARVKYARHPAVIIDGEFQFDAALIPAIAERKAPRSPLRGNANIYIFPDLNAGNISYKITERLGGFTAIGPVLQGLSKPASDLSRGCTAEDIYYAAVVTLLQGRA